MDHEFISRGKRVDNGEWVGGYYVKYKPCASKDEYIVGFVPEYASYLFLIEVELKTVGRYTGLTDKNGRKIFEGDICRDESNIYLIVWNMHGWQCKIISSDFSLTLDCSFPLWQYDNCKENGYRTLEIIGNIHDNPELLGGAENE